jgi:CMP/dCMP kinase
MPVITISRMFGSGGSEVAARVAEQLGWSLVDNQFVDEVARRLGVAPAEVAAREERVPSLAERLAATLALASPEMLPPMTEGLPPTEEDLVTVSQRVAAEAIQAGPAVLVGRGAQSLLAERSDALHLFCHAPMAALVRRVSGRMGISPERAREEVEETNKQREQYVRRHWKREWRAAANYHLTIDTDWMGIPGTADLVARLARERF